MTKTAVVSVATQVRRLAKSHNVTAERDGMGRMAVAITRMAGDVVELDNVEQLLVNLKRKGVLSKSEILTLQGGYLQEKRDSKKKKQRMSFDPFGDVYSKPLSSLLAPIPAW
ncbi:hypothetical protein ACL2XP_05450 [Sodalis sp. RH21]|uniref:hypothetical protein n=1 Tax=unclassified Sodalis (in: enterobacteria) TaxID=2636512 RepID=UPI0039B68800